MRHLSRDAHVTHTGISAHPKGVGKTPGKVVLSAPTHIRRFATCTRCRSQDFRWTGGASGRHGPEGRRSVRGESGAPPSFAFDGPFHDRCTPGWRAIAAHICVLGPRLAGAI